MSVWPLVRTDLRLQLRYGFYAAYAFVAAAYILLLRALPPESRLLALPPILLSEASVIGFFFAGTLLHLERSDGVLSALAVTPLAGLAYLLSKTALLSLLTALVALVIAWATLGATVNAPLLAAAAALAFVLAPEPWRWLAAPSPHFWLVGLVVARDAAALGFWARFAAGLAVHLAALSGSRACSGARSG